MLGFINHRRRSIASRVSAWVVGAVIVCFISAGKPAYAELMTSSFADSSSRLAMPTEDFLGGIEMDLTYETGAAGAPASTDVDQEVYPPPSEKSSQDVFARLGIDSRGSTNSNGGATGSSNGSVWSSSPIAITSGSGDQPFVMLMGWFRTEQFLFVPPAPRSGLLRPPRVLA